MKGSKTSEIKTGKQKNTGIEKISKSKEKRTEIAFQYFPGTTLSIKEVDAIVKLHSLSIICFCKYYIRRQILNVIYLNILATILLIANKC